MDNRKERSLTNIIDTKECSEKEAIALRDFFLKGTHSGSETQRRLNGLKYTFNVTSLQSYGIYNRIMFRYSENGDVSVHYVAGQSYPDEIRTCRQLLCK
jgi:hypothetical protein